jgi:hypothetical protein
VDYTLKINLGDMTISAMTNWDFHLENFGCSHVEVHMTSTLGISHPAEE